MKLRGSMFTAARLRLTIIYSVLLVGLFGLFSFGLYSWMERSFGEDYIAKVQQRSIEDGAMSPGKAAIAVEAGEIALNQLANRLLLLNGGLVIVIPVAAWYLTKRTLAPIEATHERQRQFTADASHELRTPLTVLSGELEVALHKSQSAAEYRKTLKSNKEEVDRLKGLVENLLFLAKEDHMSQALQYAKVDLVDCLSRVIARLRRVSQAKKVSMNFEPPEHNVLIEGQASLLEQLFYNLLENAVRYTRPGGRVTIGCSFDGETATIVVKDNGHGIPKAELTKIFDRFYRADTSRSQVKGHGLGLAISRSIVQCHKGTIQVESKTGGTIFTVNLPLRQK